MVRPRTWLGVAGLLVSALLGYQAPLFAAEHVTLRNGFDLTCDHRDTVGEHVRLYLGAGPDNFVEVGAGEVSSVENVLLPPVAVPTPTQILKIPSPPANPTPAELRSMMAKAGAQKNLDVDLLASVIRAESGGRIRAVSRTGARGLMQLMPGTAQQLGVSDSFQPDQNIQGGTTYLNALLLRYRDNLALALAAYNAGPAAVDKYHGIPPYRETRAYVARVIHEFNRRKLLAASLPGTATIAQLAAK